MQQHHSLRTHTEVQ